MPARRTATTKRRLPYALDALESISSRGVGSASAEEPDLLPTHNPAISNNILAQKQPDPEMILSAQPTDDTPMDEDDLILLPDTAREENALLTLRKRYKRARCNLMRVNSHLDFIRECQQKQLTPKGLRVNVKCNALLKDLTDVGHRFKETTACAEKQYLEALVAHYQTATTKLEEEKQSIEALMEDTCQRTRDKKTADTHRELLRKTLDNMDKKEKALDTKKKRKMELMSEPPPPKARRPPPPPQRRGMSKANNVTRPNNSRPRTIRNTPTTRPPTNSVHVNPNLSNEPQVTTLLTGLLNHLNRGYLTINPTVQQQPTLHGPATNAPNLQQPQLPGLGFLGWQPPPLSYPGFNGGQPQQNFG